MYVIWHTNRMILMLHILIALATLAGSIYAVIHPTSRHTGLVYAGIGMTVLSGVVLVFLTPHVLLHACVSGTVTIVATLGMQHVARRRMSAAESAK